MQLDDGRTIRVKGTSKEKVTRAVEAFIADGTSKEKGAPGGEYRYEGVSVEVVAQPEARRLLKEIDFVFPLFLLGTALALYAVSRALGWIIAGFVAA